MTDICNGCKQITPEEIKNQEIDNKVLNIFARNTDDEKIDLIKELLKEQRDEYRRNIEMWFRNNSQFVFPEDEDLLQDLLKKI